MEIAEISAKVVDLQEEFAAKGSKLMISDAGCGAAFAKAALDGAILNVRVNTKLMKDREYAEKLNERCEYLAAEFGKKAEAIYASVLDSLK